MEAMLQQGKLDDYVIAMGETHLISESLVVVLDKFCKGINQDDC